MRSIKPLAALAMVAAFLAICLVPVADATVTYDVPSNIVLDSANGGVIQFNVKNTGSAFKTDVIATSTIPGYTKLFEDVFVDTGDSVLTFEFKGVANSPGKYIIVFDFGEKFAEQTVNLPVTVETSLFSSWVPYAAIAIAVIIIVAFIFIKNRNAPKKETPMTFEQLEAEQRAAKAEKRGVKDVKSEAPSTERKKYTGKK